MREADTPAHDDKDTRKQHLNTLALATKQLDLAQKLDPDAVLESQFSDVLPYRFSVNELKAEALVLEGMTHQVYDIKRAISALGVSHMTLWRAMKREPVEVVAQRRIAPARPRRQMQKRSRQVRRKGRA